MINMKKYAEVLNLDNRGRSARMVKPNRHQLWFRNLDRLFWALWALLPVMVWLAYRANVSLPAIAATLPPEEAHCLKLLPSPLNMSEGGKILFWTLFAFEISIYPVLLFILHRIVHRFATGSIFVVETLASLGLMGAILIVWPFLQTLANNIVIYLLAKRHDLPAWIPTYGVDIGPIAVGILLISLKLVIDHAIGLKAENDLTI